MADGHSAGQIILQLHDCIVSSDTLNDRQKSSICERLAVSRLHPTKLTMLFCEERIPLQGLLHCAVFVISSIL